jgi:hypothetical protein
MQGFFENLAHLNAWRESIAHAAPKSSVLKAAGKLNTTEGHYHD